MEKIIKTLLEKSFFISRLQKEKILNSLNGFPETQQKTIFEKLEKALILEKKILVELFKKHPEWISNIKKIRQDQYKQYFLNKENNNHEDVQKELSRLEQIFKNL